MAKSYEKKQCGGESWAVALYMLAQRPRGV